MSRTQKQIHRIGIGDHKCYYDPNKTDKEVRNREVRNQSKQIVSRIRQESEISDMMDTTLYKATV